MTFSKSAFARNAMALGLSAALLVPTAVFAADSLTASDLGTDAIKGSIKLGSGDIRTTAARIINVALGFLGIIAVGIVLIGGFKYMIAGGNEQKTTEARQWIVSGIIGLAIILSAWAITSYVISNLVNATMDTPLP